ncbi:hypothetical protein ACOMHN_032249 [Nucella lapillus]
MRSIKFIPRCTKSRNSLRQQKWFATFTDVKSYYSPTPQPYSTTLYSPTAPTLYSPTTVLFLQPYSTTLYSPTAPTGTLYSNTPTTNLPLEEVCRQLQQNTNEDQPSHLPTCAPPGYSSF